MAMKRDKYIFQRQIDQHFVIAKGAKKDTDLKERILEIERIVNSLTSITEQSLCFSQGYGPLEVRPYI